MSTGDSPSNARLAEFKALRDESLRCAQLLSNAVWVAVTGYAVTLGAGAAFLGRTGAGGRQVREELLLPATMALLCLEAIAISAMYLSELWKYIRVGAYIREAGDLPGEWEKWIANHRAFELYAGSLVYLQLPVVVTVAGALFALSTGATRPDVPAGSLQEFAGWLIADGSLTAIIVAVLVIDFLVVGWLAWRLKLAVGGNFDRPRPVRAVRHWLSHWWSALRGAA